MDAATSNCCVGQPVASITFQAFRIPRIWRGMGRGQSVFLLKDFSQTTHPLSEKDFCDESQRLSSKHGSLQYIIFMLLSQRLCFVASSFWIDGWCDESHWVSSKLLLQSLWSLCLMKRQKKLGAAWTPRGYWNITALGFAKKTAAGNVEGNFSFVMKVAGFHHKNLATFWILFCDVHFLCQHAFWMSDLFLTDVGHLHQKKCATCWQVCCHRIFFDGWWLRSSKNVPTVDHVADHFFDECWPLSSKNVMSADGFYVMCIPCLFVSRAIVFFPLMLQLPDFQWSRLFFSCTARLQCRSFVRELPTL